MTKRWMDGINAQAMDKFMADLRSGEFQQGRALLKTSEGHLCCLGVATVTNMETCGLAEKEEKDGAFDGYSFFDSEKRRFRTLMPIVVMDHLGIPEAYREVSWNDGSIYVVHHEDDETYPVTREGRNVVDVVGLNDNDQRTFAEIADRFEETFMVDVED